MTGWDWAGIAGLGVFHGLNPAMGWLFALALGLQERSRKALLLALAPIAVGHEASIGVTVLLVEELRVLASDAPIRIAGAALLAALATWQLVRTHRHRARPPLRLAPRELAVWSFVMSTAHGAGLMLFPFVFGIRVADDHDLPKPGDLLVLGGATAVHVAAMAVVAAATALVVYDIVGVGFLRRGWINLDRLWAYSLAAAAATTLLVA